MGKTKDLTGMKFGRWTVVKLSELRNKQVYWLCRCECGAVREVQGPRLLHGKSKSCGCLSIDKKKHLANSRIGERRKMNNGLYATCIRYIKHTDTFEQIIEVTFENGYITQSYYSSFKKGAIKCPMVIMIVGDYATCYNPNTKNQNKFLVDINDVPMVHQSWWSITKQGYVQREDGQLLHRILLNVTNHNTVVDHINRGTLDNRRSNLRICTYSQNSCNSVHRKRKSNTSQYRGVTKRDRLKPWTAKIRIQGKHVYLGSFLNEEDAARAYNAAAVKHHGEFARINDIRGGS